MSFVLPQNGQALGALALYKQYGAAPFSQNFNIYRRLALDMMSMHDLSSPQAYRNWADLRDMLLSLVDNLRQHEDRDGVQVSIGIFPIYREFLAYNIINMCSSESVNFIFSLATIYSTRN